VILIPILGKKNTESERVRRAAGKILDDLRLHVRIEADFREQESPGWKFNEWELRGVPLRLEVGPRDVTKKQVVLVRRDTGEKFVTSTEKLAKKVPEILEAVQQALFDRSRQFLKDHTYGVSTYDEFRTIMKTKRGFLKAFWCEDSSCERRIKEETKATARCLPLDAPREKGSCLVCGKRVEHRWIFAQAY